MSGKSSASRRSGEGSAKNLNEKEAKKEGLSSSLRAQVHREKNKEAKKGGDKFFRKERDRGKSIAWSEEELWTGSRKM